MKFSISYHNLDPSETLNHFLKERSNKLIKFLSDSERVSWVMVQEDKQFNPILNLSLKGKQWSIHARGDDLYSSIHLLTKKAYRILNDRKMKERVRVIDPVFAQ